MVRQGSDAGLERNGNRHRCGTPHRRGNGDGTSRPPQPDRARAPNGPAVRALAAAAGAPHLAIELDVANGCAIVDASVDAAPRLSELDARVTYGHGSVHGPDAVSKRTVLAFTTNAARVLADSGLGVY